MNSKPSPLGGPPEDEGAFTQMQQVSVYINETDHIEHRPLYLKILELVKRYDVAGATVLKGLAGYSASSHAIHTSHLADIKQSLPLVVVIVDTESKVKELLPHLENMIRPN